VVKVFLERTHILWKSWLKFVISETCLFKTSGKTFEVFVVRFPILSLITEFQ